MADPVTPEYDAGGNIIDRQFEDAQQIARTVNPATGDTYTAQEAAAMAAQAHAAPGSRDAALAQQAQAAQAAWGAQANPFTAGTSYANTMGEQQAWTVGPGPGFDPRGYMYGRDPMAAQAAIGKAGAIGDQAFGVGNQILGQDTALAAAARARGAPMGNFGAQNAQLGYLSGLEAQQGPSAAQAQLQAGTNQAMAQQLALARSGRGLGGGAAAMGQAQGNMAGISASNANNSAMLSAQENAAWRQRQAANAGTAAGMYGQQAGQNLQAQLQSTAQNDAASLGYLGQGATAYGQGVAQNFAGQGLQHGINQAQMAGNQAQDDRMLRAWAAQQGYNLSQKQMDQQSDAAIMGAVGAVGGGLIGAFAGGPAGAAAGGAAGGAAGRALA